MNIDEYARVVAIAADGTTSVLMNPKSAISDEFMIAMLRRLIDAFEADR